MFLLNILRIKRAGLLLWPEFATVRIFLETIAWPVTCFFYPGWIVRKEQVARTLRLATYALSAVFSLSGVAGNASAQTKKSKEKKEDGSTRVIEKDFNLNVEGYPLTGNGGGHYVGPDYDWEYGRLSGFGFAEIGDKPFFSLHSITADIPGPVDVTFEQGHGPMGTFSRFGPKINLNNTPMRKVTSRVFKFILYSQIFQAVNKKAPAQSAIAWKTKSVNVGRFKLLSEGFYRFSLNNKPDLAQPQIWLRLGRLMFGLELSVFGGKLNPLFGMRVAF